ncbi:SMI1/KNR4 family protein [Verrucomicrobiaceae bacterium N1E253]|uniref:SMI1/KNR4 family protein n=1 Tax=Oceaniferula marina TaxID=2748318 RepID=A0A851GI08_9BACT|nr:SMI1/KNR4 family protein [Oceaniferula marina]NWK54260.1 SMI1/KNR4 family protein [Oceaniferula marina]
MKDAITLDQVRAKGREIENDFWNPFTPATEDEVASIESALQIQLPAQFKEFYRCIGWGGSPSGDLRIKAPKDLIDDCSVPIYHVSGSYFAGDRWADIEEHRSLWISRGSDNSNPERFTDESMDLNGVKLWDLLMVGDDESAGTHNLYVGADPGVYQYCMIHCSNVLYYADSFYEGLLRTFNDFLVSIEECALDD